MPLPDVNTLEQGDILAQQRNPGFETENLPSPNGFEVPDIPSVAPFPIAGTGANDGNTGQQAYLAKFNQSILGAKPNTTPGNLPNFTVEDIYNPRYKSILPGEDSEEAFAKAQPWYKQWGNALVKTGAIAVGTFFSGMTAIPDLISSIRGGNAYDSDLGNATDTWMKNLENQFPNYYTKWQQEHPFMSALPGSGGFSNFWGDKFVKNLGFTIGAIGSAVVTDLAVGAATEGLGEIPLIGAQVGKAALWLNKIFTGTNKAEELLALGKAAGRTGEQLLNLQKLAQAAQATKVANGARYAINLYGAAASEAGMEARDGYNTVREDLLKAYQREKGYSATGKDLEDIDKYARASGNVRFGVNLAILAVSDAIQLDAILKPFNAAKAGFRSAIQKDITERSSIGLVEDSIDEFQRLPKNLWGKIKPIVPSILTEGVFEEGGQFATQVATENYYERKYLQNKGLNKSGYAKDETPFDSRDTISNIVHSVVKGLGDEFGTDEGLENVILGGLTGAAFAGGGALYDKFFRKGQNEAHTNSVLNLLNSQGVTGILSNHYNTAATAQRISEDMKEAVRTGDIYKYKNFQHEQFVNFILSGAKAGRFDVRMEQLNMLKDMNNDDFKKAFGLDKTTDNVKTASEYVNALMEKANKIKKTYDLINDTFANPFKYNGRNTTPEAVLENKKHNIFESWKDELTYLASIASDVDTRIGSMRQDIRQINPILDHYHLSNFTDKRYLKNYAEELGKEAKTLQENIDAKISGNTEADRKRIKLLTDRIADVHAMITGTGIENNKFANHFRNLLQFHINGQTASEDQVIPQEAVDKLINYGIDINKLKQQREQAYKAFDKLSTPEGFEKYFREANIAEEKYAEKQAEATKQIPPKPGSHPPGFENGAPPPEGGTPVPPAPPVAPSKITAKNKEGKTKDLQVGTKYYTPEPVTVVGQDKDGNIIVKDESGAEKTVPADSFFEGSKNAEEVKKEIDANTSVEDVPPPTSPEAGTKEGPQKKDLSFALFSTTDPVYSRQDIPFNNFHRRHQNFLFNMGSYDPDVFNQENKPKLRIIPVTAKTATALGFPADFIKDEEESADNSTIRAVYVIDDSVNPAKRNRQKSTILNLIQKSKLPDQIKTNIKGREDQAIQELYEQARDAAGAEDQMGEKLVDALLDYGGQGLFFTNSKGEKMGRVGESVDPNEAIFSALPTTDLTFQASPGVIEERYTNKEGLDPEAAKEWWRQQRESILAIDSPQGAMQRTYQFAVSRGLPNVKNDNTRNNPIAVGLIRERDLDKAIITIPTLGDTAISGAFNGEGQGIVAAKGGVNMPLGRTLLNIGGNLVYLNSRKFTSDEAKSIFEMLKIISDRNRTVDSTPLFKYLHKVVYMANPERGLAPTPSSITITKDGHLLLGTNPTPIQLIPQALEANKDQIVGFLESTYFAAKNSELLRIARNPKANDLEFVDLRAQDGQITVAARYKNYNHYLLNSPNPPLATNIVSPQQGESPIIQKYSEILDFDFDPSKFKKAKPAKMEWVDRVPGKTDEEFAKEAVAKVIYDAAGMGGVTKENLIALKDWYNENTESQVQKDALLAAVEIIIDRIEQKDKEQAVKQEEPEVKESKFGKYIEIKYEGKNTKIYFIPESVDHFIKNGYFSAFVNKSGLEDEKFKATAKLYESALKQRGYEYDYSKIVYHKDAGTAILPLVAIKEETKQKIEKPKEEPLKYLEDARLGNKKLGFRVLATDEQGNITDIEPVGIINEDNSITPYKDPAAVKEILLNNLRASQIKQDDTNTDKLQETKNKFKGRDFRKGPDKFRRAYPGNDNYVKADLNKEIAEVKKIINGNFFQFEKLDAMLRTTEGGFAWGALQDNMIYLYKNAEVGTTYHEAFEAVWYHFVTGKEQQDIFDEFITRKGEFTTYHGEKIKFSEASVKEAKEQLAEEFRDYKMSGILPKQEKQRTFFQKLLDFIKWLFGMESSSRNALFKKMNKGYYRNYATSLRGPMENAEYSYYREPGLSQFSEAIVQDALQGMTAELFGKLFGENSAIMDQLEEDFETTAKSIYDRLKDDLDHYFMDEVDNEGTLFAEIGDDYNNAANEDDANAFIQQMESIRDEWGKIKDNWQSFVKEHMRYLRIFGVEFTVDDEGNTEIADEDDPDDDNKNQSSYDRDIFTVDAKNNASTRVKLLIASIADSEWFKGSVAAGIDAAKSVRSKRESSSLRLPKLVQYAKLFNYLLHNSAGINGLYDIWGKFTQMTEDVLGRKAIDANLRKLMNRLKFDNGFEGKTESDARLIMSTENTLTKQKPGFFRQFTDYQGHTYFDTTVLNSKVEQVKNTWIAAIKGSRAIRPSAENRFLFTRAVAKITDNLEFLNALGIEINRADYRRLRGAKVTDFNREVNAIRSLIEKAAHDNIAIPIISAKQLDFSTRLTKLAGIYIDNMVGDDTQSQHPNLDNQPTGNFVLNNFVSTMVNDANNSLDKEDFINRQDNEYFNDIFHKDSILVNKVFFDKAGEKNKEVQVGVVEGRETWNGDNKSTSSLTEAERLLYEINNNLNGVFYTLLPADAKTEWALYLGKDAYLSAESFFGDDTSRGNEVTAFANQMYKWLQTEVDLARDYENRKFIDNLNRKPKGESREVGKSLRFFKDILPQSVVDDIHKRVIDEGEPLENVVSSSQMRAMMREYAWNRAQDSFNKLVDWKVLYLKPDNRGEEEYALFGFDKTFIDNHLGKSYYHTRTQIERMLAFREMNYIMNNIEMHKFFFGDPAQYKDELKRIKSFLSGREYTHVDMLGTSQGFNQWADSNLNKAGNNVLSLGDPGYQTYKNHYNTLTAWDVTSASLMVDEIREHLGDEAADAYEKGNEDDAGAYMTIQAYREQMWKSGGRWTSKQEKWFQWEMAWERNDKAKDGLYTYSSKELQKHDEELLKEPVDTEVAVPILKLMHSGIQTKEDVAIVSLDKASWAPLVYRWYKDSSLGHMYNAMQKGGIDYIRMESAHKVGIQKASAFNMYKEDGSFNTEAIEGAIPEMIPLKQIGVQVEQAKKEKGQTEGSQLRKIAIGDLMENGVPLDFQKGYANNQDAYNTWDKMDEEQKKAASKIYRLVKRHNEALVNLTTARTILAMRKMGMEESDEGVTIPDKKQISDFILAELERRELPRNIASAIQISPETRDFSNPLEANPQYTKIRAIIYSVLEKTVTRPKVNGGQKTLLSVTGMEKGPRVVKREVNGKPVYTADTLSFYKYGENGTQACEIMLPYWFGKALMEAGSGKTKEEVLKHLNSTEEGKKLLMGIGFRIPTQGLNSVDFFIVKDFLPEQMGDVVVFPAEITVKAGSDFDIDKMNMYLQNFYIDAKTGLPELLQYKGSEEATKAYVRELLQQGVINDEQIENALKDHEYDEAEDETFANVEKRIDIAKLLNNRENILDLYYQKTLENEYFDSIQDLISLPENYTRLLTPNDASELKGYRDEMLKLKGKSTTPLGDYGKLLSSTFMMEERQAYMSSKQVVGISAVSQTAHAIAQNLQGGLIVTDPSYQARFPANKINGKISLSGLTGPGKGDTLISNTNSQTTDGGVDVAKDKFLAEMGINKDTLSTFLALRRMGAKPWWAITYLNQPAIQEFLKEKAISKSVSQISPKVKDESDAKLLSQVEKKFGVKLTAKDIKNRPEEYSIKEMEDMIEKYAKDPSSLTVEEKKLQLFILNDFSHYDRRDGKYKGYSGLAWDLFHFYQGYNWDTARINDPNLKRLKDLKYEKANHLGISPARKVMEDTFIGTMRDAIIKLDKGLRSVINVQTGAAGSILDDIARDVFKMSGSQTIKQQIMLTAELSLVDYAIQTNAMVEGRTVNSMIPSLLLSNTPAAVYLAALRNYSDRKLSDNPMLKALIPNIDRRPGYPSTIQLLERDYDTYTSNILTDSLRELKDDATVININEDERDSKQVSQIYKRLALTAIILGGSKSGRGAFSHLIPSETYSEIVRDSLRNMRLDGFYDNLALYRGNWSNSILVPNAIKEISQDEELAAIQAGDLNPQPYYHWFVNPRVNHELAVAMGVTPDQVPMLIDQPATTFRKHRVIKMEETERDPHTKQVINRRIRLFRRVDTYDNNGIAPLQYIKEKERRVIFAEINPWGDVGIREFYNGQNQSVLPNNNKVLEASDDEILASITAVGIKTNAAQDAIISAGIQVEDQIRSRNRDQNDEDGEEDEFGNEPPTPPDDFDPNGDYGLPFAQQDDFEQFKDSLTKKCN